MTTPTERATPREDAPHWAPLNTWNQLAPRSYNRFLLCFEIDNDRQETAVKHLESCAVKLGENRPVLRSLLKVDAPFALVGTLIQQDIPVEVHDIRVTFGKAYAHLKETGFPASVFVNRMFDVMAGDVAHALILRIYTINGGLLLGIHLHHSLGDGKSIDDIISWFSAETRGDSYDTKPVILSSPFYECHCSSDENTNGYLCDPAYVSKRFPERKLVLSPISQVPANGRFIGKVFMFKVTTLSAIQNHMQQQLGGKGRPSTSVILIALLWAHSAKARICVSREANADPSTGDELVNDGTDHSRLFSIVDARKRVFDENRARYYFGNAAEVAVAELPTRDLLETCKKTTPSSGLDVIAERLRPIVRGVQDSIERVDQDFVRQRHSLYSRFPDPRKLILDYFPNDTRAFMFNSWRYLGMNAGQEWNITGADKAGYPDVIRRAGGEWNSPAAMLLPMRPGSEELEAMITVEEGAMKLLLMDEGLMGLVDRVVG
ncbi:hypothetical protein GGR58DRAFT_483774 [Xylaria digitata]|nr:hypothetical protein GGR58DRAFT_483774 [Xylaria digitata]